ncbi:hypothetical protein QR680_011238 [Steinernema hermaphroditum]|uniref:Uncharacterized protein n=1 Tax=Steinernema hermaphroditum TaxID=289476 RepID=A0AA39MD53_9BILA|nr:hypothetical protein QR680_011238 [Steinernema hermaphroditum]
MISLGHAVLFAALIASSTSQNAQEVGRATIITEDYLFCCSGWKYEKSGRSHFCTMNLEGVKQDIRNAVCKSLKGALRGDIEDEGTTICQIALKPDSTCAQTLNLNTTVKCDHQRVFSNRMVMRLPGGDFSKITIKVRGGKDQFHIRFTDGANDKKTF